MSLIKIAFNGLNAIKWAGEFSILIANLLVFLSKYIGKIRILAT
jgi:hypothetical protein